MDIIARCRSRGGFSLIELLITLSILSVLITIAFPNVQKARFCALTGEAKSNLGVLRQLQESVYTENGSFGGHVNDLGYEKPLNALYRYSVFVPAVNPAICFCVADGKVGTLAYGDQWLLYKSMINGRWQWYLWHRRLPFWLSS